MTKFSLIAVAAVAILVLALSITLLPDAPSSRFEPGTLAHGSEKSRIMSTPQGHPDLFFEYFRDIRASETGEVEYPVGYRYAEYNKAKAALKTSGGTLNWVERGPGNVGGRTRPILIDPDDPDLHTWWAGSVSGGLWKTINRGLAWQYQSDDLPVMSVTSLAMAESNHNIIYMGTGEGFGNGDGVDGNGIFRSSDKGTTWEHLAATTANADFRHVNRLAVDPANPDVVVAATGEGIFRTTDGGMSWTEVYEGPGRVQDLRVQPGNFDMQIAGANSQGVLYSTDAGLTWQLASVVWIDGFGRIEVAYSPSHPNIAYAATEGPGNATAQLYRSDDGGVSWLPTVGPPTEPDNLSFDWLGVQGWYDNTLAVHPFKPDTVFVGGIHLWRNIVLDATVTVGGPSQFDRGGSESWLSFVNFGGSAFGGTVSYLDPNAIDVVRADYTSIEIRFGQGTQKAHRFWVSETAGTFGNGGSGIPLSQYMYADYVDVPLQVWDTDNNRQLMFSFRDQADNGEFDLIEFFSSEEPGTRNDQSREYMIIHKYDYDPNNPRNIIAQEGGAANGMLYFMWPILPDSSAPWDPANLPGHTLSIGFNFGEAPERSIDKEIDPGFVVHGDQHSLETIPVDPAQGDFWLISANDGGVAWSTNNGRSFQELDRAFAGYNTAQFYGVAKKPGSPIYIAGSQDNGTWRSFGNPNNRRGWIHDIGGDGIETVWHATDPNKIMGTVQFSNIFRTVNGGAGWSESPGMPYDEANGQFFTTLGTSDLAPDNVYTVKRDGVWYSRDFGASWTLTPITEGWVFWGGGKARVSIADPEVVWAGYGLDSSPDRRLHVSKDQGVSFEAVALPTMNQAPETVISGLATHPTESGTAYALFSRYGYPRILETKDYGQTWTDLSSFDATGASTNGFPDVAVHDLVVMPHATNVLWVGTDIGLFKSKSYGKEWNYAHNGLPAVSIWRMKFRDDEVILGTHGRGVWTVPASEIDVAIEEEPGELPSGFSLAQNYPNPFNASTTIHFKVPSEAQVRLTVFDAIGRKVSVLTDRVYPPGEYDLNWNANDFASGVYFYRMESEGKLLGMQKMTLLK